MVTFEHACDTCHGLSVYPAFLTLWTHADLFFPSVGRIKTVKLMAVNLKLNLQRTSCIDWQDYQDLKFWVLLVGYCCAREDSIELAWFADQIKNMYGWLYSSGFISDSGDAFRELEALSIGFLYDGEVQRSRIATISQLLERSCDFDSSGYTPSSSMSFELV